MGIDGKFLHDIMNHLSVASGQVRILRRKIPDGTLDEEQVRRFDKIDGALDKALELAVEMRERVSAEDRSASQE